MLLSIAYDRPLFWAVFIAWIMSVVLHEFAHGIVAYWGGDYTIRERGGLTLNPIQYIHPVFSLLIPALMLLIGGIPLPGGATYVRRDLLRSRGWDSAVSAAGPATDLLLFLACAIPLHPAVGWVDPTVGPDSWTTAQIFLAATAVLQFLSMLLNLIPVPPLDGFQMISPYMDAETREKLTTPPTSNVIMIGFFIVVFSTPVVTNWIFASLARVLRAMDFPEPLYFFYAFQTALRGSA